MSRYIFDKNNPPTTTPLQKINHPLFEQSNIKVWVKRDDLNHSEIQGNKWHKLKLNLAQAVKENNTLITFGGAYSNHIAATAMAGKLMKLTTIGFIRGDELKDQPYKWSSTLITAQKNGMKLKFLSRKEYRNKETIEFKRKLKQDYYNSYIIPEGGTNSLAIKGFVDLADEINQQQKYWTHLYLPVGTGGTLAGLVKYLKPKEQQKIIGIPTAKTYQYLTSDINQYLSRDFYQTWYFQHPKTPLRYGKITPEIQQIIDEFQNRFNIKLDPIYTARMMLEFMLSIKNNELPQDSKVILLHTGGLQGCNHSR